jgi:predicted MFS family arabinose efflux permease
MTRALTLLFAIVGGAAVGNLYWAQPLLGDIADDFHVSAGSAGLLVTVTQIGYGLGVFFVVPLGDRLDRRRLIPAVMIVAVIVLVACSLARNFVVLLLTLALVGTTSVAGQLLTPLAGDLADDDDRGRVVGVVASGLLIGILVSRTVSGLIAAALGWRAVYALAAVATLTLAVVLSRAIPRIPRRADAAYPNLLTSVFENVAEHRAVQVTLALGMTTITVFSLFWTALTFLLSAAPFSYSVTQIGFVGLAGIGGAVTAQRAGRLHDRGWSVPVTGVALTLAIIALVLAMYRSHSLVAVLVTVVLLDVSIQAVSVLNQTRLMSMDPEARSRLNTALITSNFIGGAIGSALAGILWQVGGWSAVMTVGLIALAIALSIWFAFRRVLQMSLT